MHSQSRPGKRLRRFRHKYGPTIFLGFVVLCIMGFVALLMWLLTSPQFRMRP